MYVFLIVTDINTMKLKMYVYNEIENVCMRQKGVCLTPLNIKYSPR